MFISNIIKKGFGFVREIILAYFFGSSMVYANFLLLKTAADLFSQLTQGSALQASLLSNFSSLYAKEHTVSLSNVLIFSKNLAWKIFLVSQLIQIPLVFYISPENFWLFIMISLVLGVVISSNFFSSIFLIVIQGKGDFKKFSISTIVDIFVSTVLLYPLSLMFGVIGIAISRATGLGILIYKYFIPMFKETEGDKVSFGMKDINLSIMLLGNFANIIMFLSRFVVGLDAGNNITFFNYSIVLLNVFLTAIIMNVNTIVLRRLSVKKEVKLIVFSFLISLVLGIILVFGVEVYGFSIIRFIFERGAFTPEDTMLTYEFAKDLSISFIFIFIASALFQPFFSIDQKLIRRESSFMASILVLSVLVLFVIFSFTTTSARENSLIMIYSLSVLSVFLAAYSSYKYFTIKTI
jgi:putative peptidoglycan lipid II flippase